MGRVRIVRAHYSGGVGGRYSCPFALERVFIGSRSGGG